MRMQSDVALCGPRWCICTPFSDSEGKRKYCCSKKRGFEISKYEINLIERLSTKGQKRKSEEEFYYSARLKSYQNLQLERIKSSTFTKIPRLVNSVRVATFRFEIQSLQVSKIFSLIAHWYSFLQITTTTTTSFITEIKKLKFYNAIY